MIKTNNHVKYRLNLKIECLGHYNIDSSIIQCANCGYQNIVPLELHHVKKNAREHFEILDTLGRTSSEFYRALRDNKYPKDLRFPMVILCANCHKLQHSAHKQESLTWENL